MRKLAFLAVSLVMLGSSPVFAQGKTRAQVYQELIEAEQNGLNYVTDASYPDVSPIFAQQVARLKQQSQDRVGAGAAGLSAAGTPAPAARPAVDQRNASQSCVGPVSFCTPYFGN